ncbi:MAG: hypothetical protein J7K30_10225 [Deltaproteobacteria bacterium]|nr:hypothetical protein [Deltaproteobacteria bacterium]
MSEGDKDMSETRDYGLWDEEMWEIWENPSGYYTIDNNRFEYGTVAETDTVWLRPEGKESPVVDSNVKRNDPIYINGTDEFKAMVEAVRMICNIRNAKEAAKQISVIASAMT